MSNKRTGRPHIHKQGRGTLYQKKNAKGKAAGVWYASWMVGGKRVYRSTGTANRKEAEARLAEFSADVVLSKEEKTLENMVNRLSGAKAQRKAFEDSRPGLAIKDAWAVYSQSLKRKECTALVDKINAARVNAFADWMGRKYPDTVQMRHVTEKQAEEFMRGIASRFSPKTFNDYRGILLKVWKDLRAEARAIDNPWESIQRKDLKTHTRRELTVEELAAVIRLVEGEMRTLFAIGIYTGLRLGDCVRLDWGRIDLVRGFIMVKPHKTEAHGIMTRIPLAPAFAAILSETPPSQRHGPVVPELKAEYEEGETGVKRISKRIQATFEAAGIKTQTGTGRKNPKKWAGHEERQAVEVGFHSLRHTYVSLSANAGVPLAVVQSIVGHSNAAMTEHYFHVSDGALQEAAKALPDVIRAEPAPEGGKALEEAVEAKETALDELRALLARMTPEEIKEARKIIAKTGKGTK